MFKSVSLQDLGIKYYQLSPAGLSELRGELCFSTNSHGNSRIPGNHEMFTLHQCRQFRNGFVARRDMGALFWMVRGPFWTLHLVFKLLEPLSPLQGSGERSDYMGSSSCCLFQRLQSHSLPRYYTYSVKYSL